MKDIKFYIVNTAKPAHTGTCSKMSTVLNGHTFEKYFFSNQKKTTKASFLDIQVVLNLRKF
jgi:hypothetical protein